MHLDSRQKLFPYAAVAMAVLLFLGSIGAWATVDIANLSATESGMDGNGGITLALGLVAGASVIFMLMKRDAPNWVVIVPLVAFGMAVFVGLYNWADLQNGAADNAGVAAANGVDINYSVGWGLVLVTLSAFAGLILTGAPWLRTRRHR